MGAEAKRTYLVVVDDSAESRVALRFAARRAAKTDGKIEVLGIVEPQDFVQFGGVQAAIEEEQRHRIEGVVSSAIGEMGEKLGAEVNLERAPLKYAGLSYTEILISESQERMILAVPPDKWDALKRLCDSEDVEATVIGQIAGPRVTRYELQLAPGPSSAP